MRSILFLLAAFSLVGVHADELTIKTGLWETTAVTTGTMMPKPVTNVSTACVEEAVYDPQDILEGADHCRNITTSVAGNSLTFNMTCMMHGAEAKVKGQYVVVGETGEGDLSLDMKMGPIAMVMNLEWMSVYLGECEE